MIARTVFVRVLAPLLAAGVALGITGFWAPAAAAENPEKINAEIFEARTASSNPNVLVADIAITNTETKKPPKFVYEIFLDVRQVGGTESALREPETCELLSENDPTAPEGVYGCAAVVDAPGQYEMTGYINIPDGAGNLRQIEVLELTYDASDAVALAGESIGLAYVVEGSTFEVFLLGIHVALAAAWLLLAGVVTTIAMPRLRQLVSTHSLHAVEVRRGFLTSAMWTAFGGTLLTGVYLLTTQTAYEAPFAANSFSFSRYTSVTDLPYAQVYFNALYLKILVFFVMGAATVVLAAEAARQTQIAEDDTADSGSEAEDFEEDLWSRDVHFDEEGHVLHDDADGSSAVATRRRPSRPKVGASPRMLLTSVAVMIAGTAVIGICVTVLKYTHELIETANAATILGGLL